MKNNKLITNFHKFMLINRQKKHNLKLYFMENLYKSKKIKNKLKKVMNLILLNQKILKTM